MKEIQLTKGKVAVVDDEDFEWLQQWKWHVDGGYAITNIWNLSIKKCHHIRMHRLINKTPIGFETDHIDGDGLNNQKNNLRTVTHAQNMINQKIHSSNQSGHKGVAWHKREERWRAKITIRGENVYLGDFTNKNEAAKVYVEAAKKYHREFARIS